MDGPTHEMSKLTIQSRNGSYDVLIGSSLLSGAIGEADAILVDEAVVPLLGTQSANFIILKANESDKSLSTVEQVIIQMKELGLNRESTLVAIGGGFVQDIATLTSALFMRGISWTYAPTTLMAMVDSCIGGKSSINANKFKNLIGNFYPPKEILVDLAFTKTLNPNAIACGMSEAIKICYARGTQEFSTFLDLRKKALDLNTSEGEELVMHVLKSKKWFIENDEFDTGVRQLLNFGHTFGHALEAATSFKIPHGIAIGLGMLAALDFDQSTITQTETELIAGVRTILEPVESLITLGALDFDAMMFENAFAGDKKNTNTHFRPILSFGGRLEVAQVLRSEDALRRATLSMKRVLI